LWLFSINELQSRELALDPAACPTAFEALYALFVLVATPQTYDLLNMIGYSLYPLLYLLLG
jgi:hypothetical protein